MRSAGASGGPVERRPRRRRSGLAGGRALWLAAATFLVLTLVPALAARAAVDDTTPISVTSAGDPADANSGRGVAVNSSGQFVAFESRADNLSADDDDSVVNIYLHDRETGTTELISRATGAGGVGANGDSAAPAISLSGRFVAFESRATNLSDSGGNPTADVFLRDTLTDTTTLVSRGPDGLEADGDSGDPALSAGAAVVAFESRATNLSEFDGDAVQDVFSYDRTTGVTSLVSRPASGVPADGNSMDATVSSNGRRIAFASDADNLYTDDRDGFTNVYVVEPRFRLLTHVSRTATSGSQSDPANGSSTQPVISSDGAHVAFTSSATNLAGGVGIPQVFVHDLSARSTELVSRAGGATGAMGSGASSSPSVSANGRLVAFQSSAPDLIADPSGSASGVYVRDTAWDTTALLSRDSGAAGPALGNSVAPALSRHGTLLAFTTSLDVSQDEAVTELRDVVLARELNWPAPPVYVPPPDTGGDHNEHEAGGDGGAAHGGGHDASGAAAEHPAGHGAGGLHYTLRQGGLNADRLFGTPLHDKLCGGRGDDSISLGGGPDVGYGGDCGALVPPGTNTAAWWRLLFEDGIPPRIADGNDVLAGGKGDDALYGGGGRDRLVGGSGADYLSGGGGPDRLIGGPGRNRIDAGGGSDSINSANGVRERVDCGFGRDSIKADRRDVLSGCERVRIVRRARKRDSVELLPECPDGGHDCHKDGDTVVLSQARRGG